MAAAGRFAAWLRSAARRVGDIPWREISFDAAGRALVVAKAGCVVNVIHNHVCTLTPVRGPSMIPTINLTGDVIVFDRISLRWRPVAVGDVVLLLSPEDPRKTLAKRVAGLQGDTVTFRVDPRNSGERSKTVVVPEGHIWVQGDNIYDSRDSRQFGAVPSGLVQGRAFCRVWPPEGFGFIGQKV